MVCSLSPVCGDRVDVVDYSVGKEKLKSIVGLLFPTLSQCFAALSPESDVIGDGDEDIVDDLDANVDNVHLSWINYPRYSPIWRLQLLLTHSGTEVPWSGAVDAIRKQHWNVFHLLCKIIYFCLCDLKSA